MMHLTQNTKQRSVARNAMIFLTAIMLVTAAASDALAAGRGGGGEYSGGQIDGGFRGPLLNSVPSAPAPIFNPSSPYTVPASPETPVSPASPGSVFGNG
jgi:hypothetical protein